MDWLRGQIAAQADHWTLWTPVAFGSGAGAYFALPREPRLWVAGLFLFGALCLGMAARRAFSSRPTVIGLMLLAFALAGFGAAKVRTERVKGPVVAVSAHPERIEAWIVDVASPGQGGQRLLLAPIRIGDRVASEIPVRARLTLRDGAIPPAPGQVIRVLGMVNPPPPPAGPGAYDFARDAYFESVGGVGFALGAPRIVESERPAPWRLRMTMRVNAARWALTQRIVETLGTDSGGLAAAMTTGHEAFIPKQQVDDLRAAGLAHIISISGLHMAIVGGFAFAFARLLVAAWPWLALRANGKKLAALAGLAAVGGYLVLSGAPPPAERAAVTAAVAFAAILVDRQAITLHALALAAMAVMLIQPEAVTEPGFQMSFAATAALVALAEAWPRTIREISVPWPIRAVQATGVWVGASIAASFVAGLATGPFAMQHFNRVATWGLPSNLLVAPISSFLMMPALAIGAALSPFGLGEWPLKAAGFAIDLMTSIAATAAAAPHSQLIVPSGPAWTLPAAFIGILWLCLWKGPLRWVGLPLALAVNLAPRPTPPDVWVAADGAAVAVRQGKTAVLLRPEVKLFGAELWARRRGLVPAADAAQLESLFDCDRWSCVPKPGAKPAVSAAWNLKRPLKPERLEALCSGADLVILRNDFRPQTCPGTLTLSGRDFAKGGSAELYREGDGWRVVWAQDLRGRRPWSWSWGLSDTGE